MTDIKPRIDYREISELDLESISHIADDALEMHFQAIAQKATAGQLSQFLFEGDGLSAVDDDEAHVDLVRLYVERRLRVVRDLRSDLSGFSSALEALKRL